MDMPIGDSSNISNKQLLFWMFRFLKPVIPTACLAGLFLVLFVGAEIMTVRQSGRAIDLIRHLHTSDVATSAGFFAWITSSEDEARQLRNVILVLSGFVLAIAVLRYLRETTSMRMSMDMVYGIREAVYDKLQRVGFSFHDAISSGQLINRALSDLQNCRMFIQTALLVTLEILLIVGGYMVLILTRSPWIALLTLAPLPVWTWYILKFGKKVQPAGKAVMEAGDRNVSIITENIAGVHVVKAFATEDTEIRKYNRNCDLFYLRVLRRVRMFANFTPIIRTIGTISHLSLFLAVGIMMIKGELDAGDFLILGTAMGSILSRLQQVAVINEQYQNAIVSARRLHEVLTARPNVIESPIARPLPRGGRGEVRFENVTFGYDPAKPVLRNVNLYIPAGRMVAIVGPTGAGKSTLVNLLSRFYDPQEGRILIDGMDIRDAKLASLRRQIGYVFQETYLFSDTVSANISYGRPGLTHGEIEAAARLAQAHEFIEQLPRGYDTVLGERGASLSGGQRQRLAIARAIVTNPRILVLDDATASLDSETEELIRKAMRFVMQDRTTFVIAHRISTARQADIVVVLEHGQVTQVGTHEELMQHDGHYRQIAYAQLSHEPQREAEETDRPSHMDRMRRARTLDSTLPPVEPEPEPDGPAL